MAGIFLEIKFVLGVVSCSFKWPIINRQESSVFRGIKFLLIVDKKFRGNEPIVIRFFVDRSSDNLNLAETSHLGSW